MISVRRSKRQDGVKGQNKQLTCFSNSHRYCTAINSNQMNWSSTKLKKVWTILILHLHMLTNKKDRNALDNVTEKKDRPTFDNDIIGEPMVLSRGEYLFTMLWWMDEETKKLTVLFLEAALTLLARTA